MSNDSTGNESELQRAAAKGDGQAMFELGARAEEQARRLLAEARQWFERSTEAGSLDGLQALVRHAVAEREYEIAHFLLTQSEREHPDAPAERRVSVSIPDALGLLFAREDPENSGDRVDATFTIIAPDPRRAAEAIVPAVPRLMGVDEYGVEMTQEERWRHYEQTGELPYTPNYIGDVKWGLYGAFVSLDTKDMATTPMVTTMAGILAEALARNAVPAHITGWVPDLQQTFTQVAATSD